MGQRYMSIKLLVIVGAFIAFACGYAMRDFISRRRRAAARRRFLERQRQLEARRLDSLRSVTTLDWLDLPHSSDASDKR